MKFAVVICCLVASGLAAPVENNVERTNESRQLEEGSIPVAVLLVVPEEPAFREGDESMKVSAESARPLPASEERTAKIYPYEDPYASAAAAYKPTKPAAEAGNVVATFTAALSPSAIPILLNCAPKVVTGTLAESKPVAYRSVFSDLSDIFSQSNPVNDNFNLSDILGLDSPASIISSEGDDERKRRNSWIESGATRYKVSEDFPEIRAGHSL